MPSLKHIRVGDPITADLLNKIADRLEPWSKMTVAQGSHLNFMDGPFGKALVLMLPREIPARLIGDSSPYAWTALTEEPDGEYADRTGGLLGGDAAYELNGKADLDGKVVMLRWSAAGDWRFQWVGYGSDCHIGPCTYTIPEVLSFEDTYFGHTVAAIYTPDDPAIPCVGAWIGYTMLDYPGSALPCTLVCPPNSAVALRYTLRFAATSPFLPTMQTSFGQPSPFACPSGGTIPSGPWSPATTDWVRGTVSCSPTFSVSFGKQNSSSLYNCKVDPLVRILVTTPP